MSHWGSLMGGKANQFPRGVSHGPLNKGVPYLGSTDCHRGTTLPLPFQRRGGFSRRGTINGERIEGGRSRAVSKFSEPFRKGKRNLISEENLGEEKPKQKLRGKDLLRKKNIEDEHLLELQRRITTTLSGGRRERKKSASCASRGSSREAVKFAERSLPSSAKDAKGRREKNYWTAGLSKKKGRLVALKNNKRKAKPSLLGKKFCVVGLASS